MSIPAGFQLLAGYRWLDVTYSVYAHQFGVSMEFTAAGLAKLFAEPGFAELVAEIEAFMLTRHDETAAAELVAALDVEVKKSTTNPARSWVYFTTRGPDIVLKLDRDVTASRLQLNTEAHLHARLTATPGRVSAPEQYGLIRFKDVLSIRLMERVPGVSLELETAEVKADAAEVLDAELGRALPGPQRRLINDVGQNGHLHNVRVTVDADGLHHFAVIDNPETSTENGVRVVAEALAALAESGAELGVPQDLESVE